MSNSAPMSHSETQEWDLPYPLDSNRDPVENNVPASSIGFCPPSLGFNVSVPNSIPHKRPASMYNPLSNPDIHSLDSEKSSYSLPIVPTCSKSPVKTYDSNRAEQFFATSPVLQQHSDIFEYTGHTKSASVSRKSPTVVAVYPFNPRKDAEDLRYAMKGFGTDEKTIINIITKRSNKQRFEIALKFKTLYGKDLIKNLKSELSGNLSTTITALMTPREQYYAKELRNAIIGLGTDEAVLIEVLCTLTNTEMRSIRDTYQKMYHKSLENDLKKDTSGPFRCLLISLCNAGRDESMVTSGTLAIEDAKALYNAGGKRLGTDQSTFHKILCERSHEQLRLVIQEYYRLTGHNIEKAIKSEFSGDMQEGLLAVIRSIKNQPAFFAKRLHMSLVGLETADNDVIRVIVTRCEIDMGEIKKEYFATYKQTLARDIKNETSGDYKKCLLALIGES